MKSTCIYADIMAANRRHRRDVLHTSPRQTITSPQQTATNNNEQNRRDSSPRRMQCVSTSNRRRPFLLSFFLFFILTFFHSYISTAQTINDALDNNTLTFVNNSAEAWTVVTDANATGGTCMKSGTIDHDGSTEISTTITGPVVVNFNYKVSSESGFDFLWLFDNGSEVIKWSGSLNATWHSYSYDVPAGSHTLTWKYTKDVSDSDGDDCAWIDNINALTSGIFFNGNGNTAGALPGNIDFPEGTSITIPGAGTMVRTGYNFTGWNTKIDGTGTAYGAGASYTIVGVITLYAQWQYSGGGSGTEADPYKISTVAHLQALANDVNGGNNYSGQYFVVTANLDLSTVCSSTLGSWSPIGTNYSNPFRGTFDGGGYTLSNLYIEDNNSNVGLFGFVTYGTIKNFTLANPEVTGYSDVGAVTGRIDNSHLEAVVVTGGSVIGTSTDNNSVGGVVGYNSNSSKVIGCTVSETTVTGNSSNTYVGGVAGYNASSFVIGCLSNAGSLGNDGIRGRVVGSNDGAVTACYFTVLESVTAIGSGSGTLTDVEEKTIGQMNQPDVLELLNMNLVNNSVLFHYQANAGNVPKLVAGAVATYFISGTVKNSSGTALGNMVVLLMKEGVEYGRITTATDGTYQLKAIAGSSYTLQTSGSGYLLHTLPAFTLSANQTKDFTLTVVDPDYAWYVNNPSATTFTISTAAELKALSAIVSGSWGGTWNSFNGKTIRLAADIDLSAVCSATLGSWIPIGQGYSFSGTFDGGGYTISNLYIEDNNSNVGLFGYVTYGTIKNFTLANPEVTGYSSVGAAAGRLYNSHLEAVVVTGGSVTSTSTGNWSNYYVGGVVGYNSYSSKVIGCTVSETTVTGNSSNTYVGGVAGYNGGSSVIGCLSNAGSLGSDGTRGRVVGNNFGTVTACYFTAFESVTAIGSGSGTVTDVEEKTIADMNGTTELAALNAALGSENSGFMYSDNGSDIPKLTGKSFTLSFDAGSYSNPSSQSVTYGQAIGTLPIISQAGYTLEWRIDGSVITETTTWNYIADKTAIAVWLPTYSGGDGSEANPYKISTLADLQSLATEVNSGNNYRNKYFVITADIDFSAVYSPTLGSWTPIGNWSNPFGGTFDGGGYIFRNLYIESNNSLSGLFGNVSDCTIKNFTLVNPEITGTDDYSYIGAVAGIIQYSRLEAVVVTGGSITSTSTDNVGNCYVGGVVGYNGYSRVIGCTVSETTVTGNSSNTYVGGVAGYNASSFVIGCLSNAGSLGSDGIRGRVVGGNGGAVTACYFTVLESVTAIGSGSGTLTDVEEKTIADMNGTTELATLNAALVSESLAFHYRINSPAMPKLVSNSYTHLLSFDPDGGQMTTTYIDVKTGDAIGTLPVPTKTGEFFAGWKIDGNLITTTTTWTYAADQTAIAQWVVQYTLTLEPSGGTVNPTTIAVGSNQPVGTLPTPERTGYTFGGWKIDNDVITETTPWTYAADKTAVAQWSVNSYTLAFDANGGSSTGSLTATHGSTIDKPTDPTKDGYTFGGWYKEAALTTAWNFTTDVVTADITLYAKWTAEPTGILDLKILELKIYPNPATTVLNIQNIEQTNALSVEFFDLSGKLVLQVPAAEIVDVSTLPQGFYTMRAGNYRGKVMKK